MEIIVGFINTDSLWFLLVLFALLWVGNKIYNHFHTKKAARNIIDNLEKTYGKEHEYRIIYNLAEFSFLDIRF